MSKLLKEWEDLWCHFFEIAENDLGMGFEEAADYADREFDKAMKINK